MYTCMLLYTRSQWSSTIAPQNKSAVTSDEITAIKSDSAGTFRPDDPELCPEPALARIFPRTCPWRILHSEIRCWAEFLSRHSDHGGSGDNAEVCIDLAGCILRFSPSPVISARHSGQTSRIV